MRYIVSLSVMQRGAEEQLILDAVLATVSPGNSKRSRGTLGVLAAERFYCLISIGRGHTLSTHHLC